MGIVNGQPVDENYTNPAFVDANEDDGTLAKMFLDDQDPSLVSGDRVDNTQRELNAFSSFVGKVLNTVKNILPTWATSEGFLSTDSLYARTDKLSSKFPSATGHAHNPATAGDGGEIQASYLGGVKLRALIQQGVNIIGATGVSSDISLQFTLKNPSSNQTTKGVPINTPYNMVALRQASGANQGDSFYDGSGNLVYGRITFAAGVWTLSFYVLISGTETAYSFASPTDISFYYQEIFNPLTEGPVYDPAFFIPSENTTADVIDASATQSGKVNTTTQQFAGNKEFLGDTKLTGKLLAGLQSNNQSGTNVTLTVPLAPIVLLTNAGLVSIANITPPLAGQVAVLINKTGGDVLLNNANASAGDIITGTGANFTIKNNACVAIAYDFTNSRWHITGAAAQIVAQAFGTTPNANGFTYDVTTGAFQLQPADATNAGGINILSQEIMGEKRFIRGIAFQVGIDSSTTGSGQTIDGGTVGVLKVTNAGLTSVALINRLNDTAKLLVLINTTGAAIQILNLTGTETGLAKQIRTGTNGDLTLNSGASIILVYDEDSDKWQVIGGTGSGSGSGSVNFISNGDAESSPTSPFIPYADAAASRPVDGTGGSPSVTTSTTTTNPLSGTRSILLTKPAGNLQGQGWSAPLTTDIASKAKMLRVKMKYILNSGTFVAGQNVPTPSDSDVIMYIYDITNSRLIEPSNIRLLSNSSTISDEYQAEFQTSPDSINYRLIAHIATTTASAFELKVEVEAAPNQYIFGAPLSDEQLFTPPTSQGLGTLTGVELYQTRVGDKLRVRGKVVLGTTTAVEARIGLPAGLSIKSGVAKWNAGTFARGGTGATSNKGGFMLGVGGNSYINFSSTDVIGGGSVDPNNIAVGTAVGNSGETLLIEFEVPIQGWSSSVQMSDSADTRVLALRARRTAGATAIANSTEVQLNYDIVSNDTHGAYNSVTGVYTVLTAGFLAVAAKINYAPAAGASGFRGLLLKKNGTTIQQDRREPFGAGNTVTPQVFDLSYYNAGDTITLFALQNSGASVNLSSDGNATIEQEFSIHRLSGPAAIAASEKVTMAVTSTNGPAMTAGVHTTIICNTKRYDSHNIYNTSTGEFRLPRAGVAELKARFLTANLAAGTTQYYAEIRVMKNGSPYKVISGRYNVGAGTTTYTYGEGACDIEGTTADVWRVELYHPLATNVVSDATQNFIDLVMK